MGVAEVAKDLPVLGRDMVRFVGHPRQFVSIWSEQEKHASVARIVGWALAYCAVLLGIYSAIAGQSVFRSIMMSSGLVPISNPQSIASESKPIFDRIGFQPNGASVGIGFPEIVAKGLDSPQTIIIMMGAGRMSIHNVVPSKLGTKVCELLLTSLFAYFMAICLTPGFRIFKSKIPFRELSELAAFYVSTFWVFAISLMLVSVLVLVHLFKLRPVPFLIAYICTVVAPLYGLMTRAFWAGFRGLAQLSRTKFLGSLILAWVASWLVFPVVAPVIFGILRFEAILDAFI